jgi:2,4-dienoyl-CoA reductase-like NADH-dependent reductase (Old Yellow Enzyme family)
MKQLFSPLKLNSKYEIKNRLAVAPMTTTQSNEDGTISSEEAAWLERLAKDEYGLIISCAAAISKDSIAFINQLSFESDEMLLPLKALSARLKKYNSVNLIQLCHAGSRAIKSQPVSASSYTMLQIPGFVSPRMLTVSEIETIITDFVKACLRVSEAGFDGIEFHGANGYLFTQFISKMTNLRDDKYGGSLENRARFAREVVQSCRKAVPEDLIIGFRMSFENAGMETGLDIDENIRIVNWLANDGIDYIHTSQIDYNSKSVKYPDKTALQYIKSKIDPALPLIGVGGITSLHSAKKAMEYGADIVAIGRAAIGNKNLPEVFANGDELPYQNPFTELQLTDLGISRNFISYLHKMPVSSLNVVK